MPVRFPKYPPKPLTSNQHEVSVANGISTHEYQTKDGVPVHVTAPHCDWLTLTAPICISDVFKSAVMQDQDPAEYLEHLAKGARVSLGQTLSKGADPELAFKFKAKIAGYQSGHKRLGPDTASTGFYVANKPDKHGIGYAIKIDLNPARLGPKGLAEIDDLFTLLVFEELSFDTWLGRAVATRIDVAVDMANVWVGDLIFREQAAAKWSGFFGPGFEGETVTQLAQTGHGKWRPSISAYNKAKQLEGSGKPALFGAAPHTRIEARKFVRRQFRDLPKLPNPFLNYGIGYLPDAGDGLPREFNHFVHACHRVGRERALVDVPLDLHDTYVAALNTPAVFWKPDEVWKSWPEGLAQQGLLNWVKRATVAHAKAEAIKTAKQAKQPAAK